MGSYFIDFILFFVLQVVFYSFFNKESDISYFSMLGLSVLSALVHFGLDKLLEKRKRKE